MISKSPISTVPLYSYAGFYLGVSPICSFEIFSGINSLSEVLSLRPKNCYTYSFGFKEVLSKRFHNTVIMFRVSLAAMEVSQGGFHGLCSWLNLGSSISDAQHFQIGIIGFKFQLDFWIDFWNLVLFSDFTR